MQIAPHKPAKPASIKGLQGRRKQPKVRWLASCITRIDRGVKASVVPVSVICDAICKYMMGASFRSSSMRFVQPTLGESGCKQRLVLIQQAEHGSVGRGRRMQDPAGCPYGSRASRQTAARLNTSGATARCAPLLQTTVSVH